MNNNQSDIFKSTDGFCMLLSKHGTDTVMVAIETCIATLDCLYFVFLP